MNIRPFSIRYDKPTHRLIIYIDSDFVRLYSMWSQHVVFNRRLPFYRSPSFYVSNFPCLEMKELQVIRFDKNE